MSESKASKYGAPLTGSDWVGLPMRIGQIPERGSVQDLLGGCDSVLVWTGGPSHVKIDYIDPRTSQSCEHEFDRSSGMIDLLPQGTHMRTIVWSGKPSTCVSVNLPGASLAALSNQPIVGLDPKRGPQFGLIDSHAVDLARRLQEQAEGKDPLGALYIQSLSLALATYISARYGLGASDTSTPKPLALSQAQRVEIERFVNAEIASNFGLIDLASLVGYSPDHFSRLFKQSFGQSAYQYVLSRRVEKAMTMLRDEDISIAELALACGFSDQGHMTRIFRQRVGVTPGAYRKG